jgi:hypothetical protein
MNVLHQLMNMIVKRRVINLFLRNLLSTNKMNLSFYNRLLYQSGYEDIFIVKVVAR